MWIKNSSNSTVTVEIMSIYYLGFEVPSPQWFISGGSNQITIESGNMAEIGIICNYDGAFITYRTDLQDGY